MRKVFLDDLPKKEGFGANKGKQTVDWINSIGLVVKFIYDDIEGEVRLIEYRASQQSLTLLYNEKRTMMSTSVFLKCGFGKMIGVFTNEFKVNIGDVFKNDRRDIIITDRKYRKHSNGGSYKWYKYTCNKCGWTEGWMVEGKLLGREDNCSCCSGKTTVHGINSIYDTSHWMVDLGVDKYEAKKYTCCSNKKIKCICPHCNKVLYKGCNDIYSRKSIGCNCGDGYSYSEKIMYLVLQQLDIYFKTQLSKTTFKWCDKYKYDFYIPSLNVIIETHGEQHYVNSFVGISNKTLIDEQQNDYNKRELALKNGIEHYIELDCRNSEVEWIKNSILNSELNILFDLSKIDWVKAEKFALGNLAKEVCDYWNNKEEWETTATLEEIFKISKSPILKYLKLGTKLGWCNYNTREEIIKCGVRSGENNSKKVKMFKDGILLGIYNSLTEIERKSLYLFGVKLGHSQISRVCLGKQKHYKGYTFRYAENKEETQG